MASIVGQAATTVSLRVDGESVVNRIDEKVYGHFLEHIYHSCNGGLWGDLVWNRSFEQNDAGDFSLDGDHIVQRGMGANVRLVFGDPAWTDYEFSVEARKTGGNEGFLLLFRVKSDEEFYWYNFGGWGNKRHALEKGRKGARWGVVSPTVDGSIATGKWYHLRARCEGPHLQVWLDDRQVLDFTDPSDAHLAGRVGIGTWTTQAEFRDLRITDLKGKLLHEGLPDIVSCPDVAKHWTAYGPGKVYVSSDHPLNGRFSQQLVSTGHPETGIQQEPFAVLKGEDYRGSLWARGGRSGELVVRLRDADGIVAEALSGHARGEWREHRFRLRPGRSSTTASLQVAVQGRGTVWVDQVSMMSDAARDTGGFRPDLLQAVAALRPPVIRWPGGCFAEWYRWKDGIGPQHERRPYPREIWDDLDVNSLGTDEFVALCRAVGAEPLIVVNIGSHEPAEERPAYVREACEWIEYCNGSEDTPMGQLRAANGHAKPYGVKYWEIDNETWFMGVENYAAAVREFAPAMRAMDPSIKLAACGSAGYGKGGLDWNRVIIKRCADLVDYLSIHHYENPDRFAAGPRDYERFFRQTGDLIAKSRNPNLKIDVSEWNAQSTDWRTGLYCGGLLNAFERCGDILEIGGPALFLRHLSATGWDNAFINFDHTGWFPAPNYLMMKLWRDHYAPERLALVGKADPLNVVATRTADGRRIYVKAVNPAETAVTLALSVPAAFSGGEAALELVAPGDLHARNTLAEPGKIAPVPGTVSWDRDILRCTLPPYAAGVVTVERR